MDVNRGTARPDWDPYADDGYGLGYCSTACEQSFDT